MYSKIDLIFFIIIVSILTRMTNKIINLSDITPPPMVHTKKSCDDCTGKTISNLTISKKTQTNPIPIAGEDIVEWKTDIDKSMSGPVQNHSIPC